MKVKLQPPSSTELPPFNPIFNPPPITQVMVIANPLKVSNYCDATSTIVIQQALLSYNKHYCDTSIIVIQQALLSYNKHYCDATSIIVMQQTLL